MLIDLPFLLLLLREGWNGNLAVGSCCCFCHRCRQLYPRHLRLNQVARLGRGKLLTLCATTSVPLPVFHGLCATRRTTVAAMAMTKLARSPNPLI